MVKYAINHIIKHTVKYTLKYILDKLHFGVYYKKQKNIHHIAHYIVIVKNIKINKKKSK